MLNQLVMFLQQHGYQALGPDQPGVFVCEKEHVVYIIILEKYPHRIQAEEYNNYQRRIEFLVAVKYQKQMKTLHLLLMENGMFEDSVMQLVEELSNIWLVARDTGRIYIYENQQQDFDDLYEPLSDSLQNAARKNKEKNAFRLTPVNMVIVGLNVVAFLSVIILNGGYFAVYDTDIMLRMGAMAPASVMNGSWYQMFTSLFLHFGWQHLFNNMLLLTYVGCELESRIGKISYLILYVGSGMVGNMASLLYYLQQDSQVVSAGASGAIFGVIGALFAFLLVNRTKTDNITPKRLFLLSFFTIYYGLTSTGVDNAAHIGGLIAGIIGGFLLSKISYYGKLK